MQPNVPAAASLQSVRRVSQRDLVRFGMRLDHAPVREGLDVCQRASLQLTVPRITAITASVEAVMAVVAPEAAAVRPSVAAAAISRRYEGQPLLAYAAHDCERRGEIGDNFGQVTLDDGAEIDAVQGPGEIGIIEVVIEGHADNGCRKDSASLFG